MENLSAVTSDAHAAGSFACVHFCLWVGLARCHDTYPTQKLRNPLFEMYYYDNGRRNDQSGAELGKGLKMGLQKKKSEMFVCVILFSLLLRQLLDENALT